MRSDSSASLCSLSHSGPVSPERQLAPPPPRRGTEGLPGSRLQDWLRWLVVTSPPPLYMQHGGGGRPWGCSVSFFSQEINVRGLHSPAPRGPGPRVNARVEGRGCGRVPSLWRAARGRTGRRPASWPPRWGSPGSPTVDSCAHQPPGCGHLPSRKASPRFCSAAWLRTSPGRKEHGYRVQARRRQASARGTSGPGFPPASLSERCSCNSGMR